MPLKDNTNKLKSRIKPYNRLRRIFSLETLRESDQETDFENNSALTSEFKQVNIDCASNTEDIALTISPDLSIHESLDNPGMAQANSANANIISPSDIFQSLRVPDAIKDLPHFDGNPRLLFEFLNNVEEIRSLISCTEGTPYGSLLLRAIRNKITGPANEVLNMYGTQLDWTQIKQNLILHYSDKRNETSLIRDLHGIKQQGKTVERFYSEVIEILATMTNHVQIHESEANVIKAKRDLYTEMCLNAFLSGLKEPLGSTVRAMKPETLAVAFSYCIKEQNISYARYDQSVSRTDNKLHTIPNKTILMARPSPSEILPPRNNPFIMNRTPNLQHFNNPLNQHRFNFNNRTQTPNTSTILPRLPQPSQSQNFFSRPQRPFNAYQTQPRQNSFPMRPNNLNLPKPEPMDISSGNTRQSRNSFRPQNPGQNPSNKELFNVNCEPYPDNIDANYQELDSYYENQYLTQNYGTEDNQNIYEQPEQNYQSHNSGINTQHEIDDTNFQTGASTSPLDT